MKTLIAISLVAIYGVVMRVIFGFAAAFTDVMTLTFMFFIPFGIGYMTVYFIPDNKVQTPAAGFGYPWLTTLAILVITVMIELEGIICWIILLPVFGVIAGLGGLMAYHQHKKPKQLDRLDVDEDRPLDSDFWDKNDTMQVAVWVLLPLFLGVAEGERLTSREDLLIEKTVVVDSAPEQVWDAILNKSETEIKAKSTPLNSLIGFPKHERTTLDKADIGGKRMIYYERGLFFEETIKEIIPNQKLVLDIHADPNKIPPTVMDEHIIIGGKHLDLLEDVYSLEEMTNGQTKVTLSSSFYINTPCNWYASWWAEMLMKDMLKGELNLIKKMAESI